MVAEVSIGLSNAVTAKLFFLDLIKRTIQKVRQIQNAPHPNPASCDRNSQFQVNTGSQPMEKSYCGLTEVPTMSVSSYLTPITIYSCLLLQITGMLYHSWQCFNCSLHRDMQRKLMIMPVSGGGG